MKPNFALNLTHDSIVLLHRAAKGWLEVGSADLDAPDLGEALNYLRRSALGLAPHGVTTKLVIPNSQILYLTVEAPGPDLPQRQAQIRRALEGRTPYPVDDLVYDWTGDGAHVLVAVVARETLDEAEQFAAQYRFNPVSFVAMPEGTEFAGEVWFGQTSASNALLPAGEKVERDHEVIHVITRDGGRADSAAVDPVMVDADPQPDPEPLPIPEPAPGPMPTPEPVPEPEPQPAPTPPEVVPEIAPEPETIPEPEITPEPEPLPEPEPWQPPTEPAPEPIPVELPDFAPELPFDPPAELSAAPVMAEATVTPALSVTAPSIPPDPQPTPAPAFNSRRSPDLAAPDMAQGAAPRVRIDVPPPASAKAKPQLAPAIAKGAKAAKALGGLVTAPSIPGSIPGMGVRKPKVAIPASPAKAAGQAPTKAASKAEAVFSPRTPVQRGKPRYLGLILTGLLLLFLAVVAAWSSIFLASLNDDAVETDVASVAAPEAAADGASEAVSAPAPIDVAAATAVPSIDDEALADMQDPAAITVETPEPTAEAPAETGAAAPTVADTTAEAPSNAAAPQDEIFLATMDAAPVLQDALALPRPQARPDTLPVSQLPPPPFGTQYEFQPDGLIKPTAEGIITPEGVRLVAGPPPRTPPARPESVIAAAAAAAAPDPAAPSASTAALDTPTVEPTPADPALAGFRPRARPEGLTPPPAATAEDDAALAIPEASRMVSLRPRARPETVVALGEKARQETEAASLAAAAAAVAEAVAAEEAAAAEAAAKGPVSKLAVAVSRKPPTRPKDFTKAVEAAVAAAVRTPDPAPTQSAAIVAPAPEPEPQPTARVEPEADDEPEVATAMPKIPTKASVAKQATFVNAINLSKTNLIGIYGTSSKRYALIRTSSGQYKKVKVGDRIDGGTVAAITNEELRYKKGSRILALTMPNG